MKKRKKREREKDIYNNIERQIYFISRKCDSITSPLINLTISIHFGVKYFKLESHEDYFTIQGQC